MSKNNITKENIRFTLTLTGAMLGFWSFVSGLLQGLLGFIKPESFSPAVALKPIPYLFLVCLANSIIVVWYTGKSPYSGMKLAVNIFTIVFGVMFFMTQIETIYFNYAIKMPWGIIISTLASGLVVGVVCAIFAVKIKGKSPGADSYEKLDMPFGRLLAGMSIISITYTVFYFFFGYFVAWQFPVLRQFYSGTSDILPFWTHMMNQVSQDPGLILFQIFRGYLWAIIGYIALRGVSIKSPGEKYILIGLVLSIGLCTPLFMPNDYMPAGVRLGHFFELLIENFLLGIILVYLLDMKPAKLNRGTSKNINR